MPCLVCDHSKRFAIETAIREGMPKLRVSKIFGIRRQTLQDHIRFKHEEKNPAKPPDPSIVDADPHPLPNDAQIACMYSRRERVEYVERLIEERRFFGSETLTRLARLWRENAVKQDVGLHVAELFAEALKRQTLARGPRALRRQFAVAELLSMYRVCRESGDNKTALAAFLQYIELDEIKDNPSMDRAVLVQIVQLIKHEFPHASSRVNEYLAQFEIVVDQAKAVLNGEIEPQLLPESVATIEDPGIDTRNLIVEEPSSE
jgi:hypothetical protein